MIRLYHPNLEPPHNECVALTEEQAAIYEQSGWRRAPEPEARPGYAPDPVVYEPVAPKARRGAKTPPAEGEDNPTSD